MCMFTPLVVLLSVEVVFVVSVSLASTMYVPAGLGSTGGRKRSRGGVGQRS